MGAGQVVLVVAGYLVGTFPSAAVVGRRLGFDTAAGSGNPGATNALRLGGRRAGVAVLALDVAKGVVPALVGGLAAGAAAVVGHVLPATRRFRGGKGVATAAGVTVVIEPAVAGVAALVWLAAIAVTRWASVGSLAAVVAMPVGAAVAGRPAVETLAWVGIAGLVVARHADNVRRLAAGQEPRVRWRGSRGA